MSSHDVRDMLDLPGEATPRPTKKAKLSAPRQVLKGLAREVQNLGGDNPIAIVPEVTMFKKRRFGARKPAAKWELRQFTNSARQDKDFRLRHWKRKDDIPPVAAMEDGPVKEESVHGAVPVVEDSSFAKYNVQVSVPQYDDEIYNSKLKDENWTRDETDYLLELAQEYDLRWPIVWDRYEYSPPVPQMEDGAMEVAIVQMPKERSQEDLKERYYKVAAHMMEVNKKIESMNHAEFNVLELMRNYNAANEKKRKEFAEATFTRTKEEVREEESLVLELNRIMKRSEKLNEDRQELYARLEAPAARDNVAMFTTSAGLQQLLQQLMSTDKTKKNSRRIEGISPAGTNNPNLPPGLDRRESSVRESISGPSGSMSNKKGGAQPGVSERRILGPDEEAMFGVRKVDKVAASGPSFRHDKIMKSLIGKSASQQTRISNVLTELGIKARLIMPTQQVGDAFENLLANVTLMLDERKRIDKVMGEIALEEAKIEARAAAARAERGEPEPAAVKDEGDDGDVDRKTDGPAESNKTEGVREASAPAARPGSGNKRSASVLSSGGDNDAKRIKTQN